MGRWGLSELPQPPANVVGLMSHLATADTDPAFARAAARALPRGDRAVRAPDAPHREQRGRAAAPRRALRRRPLRDRALRDLAVRHRSGRGRAAAGALVAEPARAGAACSQPGESTGYGRRFVAERPTWIGIVPVGYADGFRRDLTGTEVLVDGEPRRSSAPSRWTRSPSSSTASCRSGRRSRSSATAC